MNCKILTYEAIDRGEWSRLVQTSATGTWFQSPEAYGFYESLPELFRPFVIAVERVNELGNERVSELKGISVGYITVEQSTIKQFFTRRAIIIGGPALANDCTDEEVYALMAAVREQPILNNVLRTATGSPIGQSSSPVKGRTSDSPIYIECRNFNDYSRWREAFETAGFGYKPHLNFHVDCGDEMAMWDRLSENRRRQLRRSDAEIILIENKNKENTADAEKNSENNFEVIKNAHSTSAVLDGPRGLERNHQQALTSELAAPVDANTPNLLQEEQHVECFQKCALLTKNDKNEEDIREWYEILRELYRTKVKTPLWPVEFFLEAYRQGVGKFLLVKHEGKIIGGSMVVCKGLSVTGDGLRDNKSCVYEWFECGMNAEYKEQYPSVMATWAGMKYAAEHGCARYDMMGAGEPGVPYGVRDFKSEFGGELVEHGRYLCVTKPLLYQVGKLGVWLLKRLK